ncbi:MAG: NAD-dependent epimerase/dehydratase family protein [Odoribacteraceae bacterium]|nr:NAD-dependent epimerase/dehydratase family protein [Odoribacteraceae bacterium]
MKILLVGGTGTISAAVSRRLVEDGHHLYVVNRGNRNDLLPAAGVTRLLADARDEQAVAQLVAPLEFDAVADFVAFTPAHLEQDYRLFKHKTRQFIFISSASAYRKPPEGYRVTEDTPLGNPFSAYAREKIACEEYLARLRGQEGFPVTIVRPSFTYAERTVPLGVRGERGSWQVIRRMIEGKPVIIHGDGTSLWTMTHARDFARGFAGLTGNPAAIGEAVHVTSDETLTWNQVYEGIADALGVPLRAVHVASEFLAACSDNDLAASLIGDKANSVVFDNAKIKRLVPGFEATIPFRVGIKETIDNILARPELQLPDEAFDRWCDRVIDTRQEAIARVRQGF